MAAGMCVLRKGDDVQLSVGEALQNAVRGAQQGHVVQSFKEGGGRVAVPLCTQAAGNHVDVGGHVCYGLLFFTCGVSNGLKKKRRKALPAFLGPTAICSGT